MCLKYVLLVIAMIYINAGILAQPNIMSVEEKLNSVASDIPALNKTIDISVTNVPIQEFLRGIANSSGLNINVDPSLNIQVINNFSNVKVLDILVFLCKEYNLDLTIIGNIISVNKGLVQQEPAPVVHHVLYDSISGLLNVDYQNQDLMSVAKEITLVTGKNVVLSPGLDQMKINSYIQNMPFESALDKLAYANNLELKKTDDNFYILAKTSSEKQQTGTVTQDNNSRIRQDRPGKGNDDTFELRTKVFNGDSVQVYAVNAPIDVVIKEVSDKLGVNYFITAAIDGRITMSISGTDYQDFLRSILNGSLCTFRKQKGIFLIGSTKTDEVKEYRVIQLQNRTITKLLDVFPDGLKAGLELKEFADLNSLLVGGPPSRIDEVEQFVQKLDKIVPVILIEVLIVNMNKTYTVATGINAGIGNQPVTTQGTVFPSTDIQLGSQSINNLINSMNGFGVVKIGKVTPNFYLSLKAMESQGILKVNSTPKLSTLNGHDATMSIGKTEYYQETRTDIYGTQNPQLTTTQNYKPVNADLTVTIKPVVAGDDQITLEIEVNQSDFTERISSLAPPGETSRKFKSIIRVRNQEMVLLGGLEEKKISDTSTGTPFLSRIPVIKWLFSSRTKVNGNSRLNIFIKPTIIN